MCLGKAVSKGLKFRSEVLLNEFSDKFGTNFEKNKLSLNEMPLGLSKSQRNIVAGYMVRIAKKKEDEIRAEKKIRTVAA